MAKKNAMRGYVEDPADDTMEFVIDANQHAGYDMESH